MAWLVKRVGDVVASGLASARAGGESGDGAFRHGRHAGHPRRPAAAAAGPISAEGKAIKLGRQTSYTEGFVRDGKGALAVHATATFSMVGNVLT